MRVSIVIAAVSAVLPLVSAGPILLPKKGCTGGVNEHCCNGPPIQCAMKSFKGYMRPSQIIEYAIKLEIISNKNKKREPEPIVAPEVEIIAQTAI